MASFCDVDEYLQQLSALYPHYHVGEASERFEGTIRSWIVGIKMDRGDILLMSPEEKSQVRDDAITVEELYQAIVSFSPKDQDPIELCLFESNGFSIHNGIVGAHVMHDEQALVFLAWDGSGD